MTSHMTPEEFRRRGYEVVDWVADYLERVEELPVMSQVEPGEIAAMVPGHAPEQPESFDALLRDLDDIVLPGITNWQSPNWYAYFPANASPPSILAELASAGLGAQGMLWSTSPASTPVNPWSISRLTIPVKGNC